MLREPTMAEVRLERVVKRYGNVTALQSIDLEIQEGEFLTLLGPSGCGKPTTLRLIAGFIEPSAGRRYLSLGYRGQPRQPRAVHRLCS